MEGEEEKCQIDRRKLNQDKKKDPMAAEMFFFLYEAKES